MEWTCDNPTQPGWYWVKTNANAATIVQVIQQSTNVHNTIAPALVVSGYTLTGGEQWCGPLEIPT